VRLGKLLALIAAGGAGWVSDGHLIAYRSRWRPVHDFAAAGRAVFAADREVLVSLHCDAFDLLATRDGGDVQA
jgi:hypothetical protein